MKQHFEVPRIVRRAGLIEWLAQVLVAGACR
jgi:hypothetical protein